jgi:hypothetical protein
VASTVDPGKLRLTYARMTLKRMVSLKSDQEVIDDALDKYIAAIREVYPRWPKMTSSESVWETATQIEKQLIEEAEANARG